jgi:hypothetical protein
LPTATTSIHRQSHGPRRNRQILAAARLLEEQSLLYEQAVAALEDSYHSAMEPSAPQGGQTKVAQSLGSSSVESAIVARDSNRETLAQVQAEAQDIAMRIWRWNGVLRGIVRPEPEPPVEATNPEDRLLCSCFGLTGEEEWGDRNCPDRPVKAGLCLRHYNAEYYYRRKHELPPRSYEEPGGSMPDGYHTEGPPPQDTTP